jgi:E3 ubiquitin-protein ligase mind-bomb
MNDTHDLTHPFRRFDSASSSVGVEISPRHESPKIVSKGIFAGARVVRGPDWDWGNQDGGEGKVGRVVDIRGWDSESGRSVANVIWSSGSTNVYRLGHKGKVDLKCVQASSAGSYYVNHLSVLGMPSTTINRNSSSGSSNKPVSSKNSLNFNVGDKVQVIQDVSTLKELQEGHGGWNPRMGEVSIYFQHILCLAVSTNN